MKLRLTSCGWLACVMLAMTPACGDDGGGETTTGPSTDPATEPDPTTENGTTTPNPTEGTDTGETTEDPTTTGPTTTEGTTGPGPDPAIVMQCTDRFAGEAELLTAQCQCAVDLGDFPSVEECLAEIKGGGQDEPEACICDNIAAYADSKTWLDCVLAAQGPAIECAKGVMCVDNPGPLLDCLQPYSEALFECGEPPKPAQAQVEIQCNMAAPVECGSGEVIPDTWDCNTVVDCADKSDENDCPDTFACTDGTQFFPNSYKCDGYADCTDGSDETEAMGCVLFMCMDGSTIPEEFKCNGFPECPDDSDEGAAAMCPVFMCMNGQQIPEAYKCNGFSECCENDPDPMCMDESDEMDCPMFMCMDGAMIPEAWKCDGFPDCRDASDEADCP